LDGEEQSRPESESNYQAILNQADFESWLQKLKAAKLIAVDTETTSIDYMQAELVGFSFAVEPGEAVYIPVGHTYPGAPDQLPLEQVLAALKPLLEDPGLPKVGQHLKYDMNVLQRYGIHVKGVAFDTMLESYVLDATGTRHDMDSLALKYLGHQTIHFEDVAGKGAKQLTFNDIDLDVATDYATEDADITLQLHQEL
jgi:DNA polymerase-1